MSQFWIPPKGHIICLEKGMPHPIFGSDKVQGWAEFDSIQAAVEFYDHAVVCDPGEVRYFYQYLGQLKITEAVTERIVRDVVKKAVMQ